MAPFPSPLPMRDVLLTCSKQWSGFSCLWAGIPTGASQHAASKETLILGPSFTVRLSGPPPTENPLSRLHVCCGSCTATGISPPQPQLPGAGAVSLGSISSSLLYSATSELLVECLRITKT